MEINAAQSGQCREKSNETGREDTALGFALSPMLLWRTTLWRCGELVFKCSPGGQEIVMSARPRRSVLYMPGSNAKALAKAATLKSTSGMPNAAMTSTPKVFANSISAGPSVGSW